MKNKKFNFTVGDLVIPIDRKDNPNPYSITHPRVTSLMQVTEVSGNEFTGKILEITDPDFKKHKNAEFSGLNPKCFKIQSTVAPHDFVYHNSEVYSVRKIRGSKALLESPTDMCLVDVASLVPLNTTNPIITSKDTLLGDLIPQRVKFKKFVKESNFTLAEVVAAIKDPDGTIVTKKVSIPVTSLVSKSQEKSQEEMPC